MLTKLWLFPNGIEFNVKLFPQEIDRCMKLGQPQVLTLGEHSIEPVGMVNQGNDYVVNVQQHQVQLFIMRRPGIANKMGPTGTLQQDRVFTLPEQGRFVPIVSGKYDCKIYLFALIEVS